jgi:hypothetical protein
MDPYTKRKKNVRYSLIREIKHSCNNNDIPESQRLLGTKSIIEGSQSGGCTRLLRGSKGSSSAGNKGESGNGLHGDKIGYFGVKKSVME